MRIAKIFEFAGNGRRQCYGNGCDHRDQDLDARRLASSAAPSWYVLLRSKDLGRQPIGLSGRGENLVVWRGRSGRAIAMQRYCPHHGADLALGCIQDGELRCRFHGWRFDESGACVAIPGEMKIPSSAHRRLRHIEERYGLVWIWSGTGSPLFPMPTIPELDGTPTNAASHYYVHQYHHDIGSAPFSRMHENAVDTVHVSELHHVSLEAVNCTVLERPCWDVGDPRRPAYADVGAWFGNILEFELQQQHGVPRIANILGVPLGATRVIIDKWPSGSIIRTHSDGRHRHTLVYAESPYGSSQRSGTLYGISITPRYRGWMRDLISHLILTITNRWFLLQDLGVWRTLGSSYDGVLVKSDAPIMAYRRWYIGWVKATRHESELHAQIRSANTPP